MICRICNAKIEDDSIFCRFCGARIAKTRREIQTAPARYPKATRRSDGTWTCRIMLDGERTPVEAETIELLHAKVDALRTGLLERQAKRYMTLGECIDKYLETNAPRLSPSTLKSYKSYREHQLQDLMSENIYNFKLNPSESIFSSLTGKNTKTIKNAWSLCMAAMREQGVEPMKIKFPPLVKKEHAFLDYKQIPIFLDAIKGTNIELPALLGLHSLRCSEILALTGSSIQDGVIRVRGAVVEGPDGLVFRELNKTDKSRRDVPVMIPRLEELVKDAPKDKPLVTLTEKWMYYGINKVCREAGLPEIGLHGLRHSFASLAGSHLGLREESVQALGGWVNSAVVKDVYTHNADLEADVKKLKKYFKKAK